MDISSPELSRTPSLLSATHPSRERRLAAGGGDLTEGCPWRVEQLLQQQRQQPQQASAYPDSSVRPRTAVSPPPSCATVFIWPSPTGTLPPQERVGITLLSLYSSLLLLLLLLSVLCRRGGVALPGSGRDDVCVFFKRRRSGRAADAELVSARRPAASAGCVCRACSWGWGGQRLKMSSWQGVGRLCAVSCFPSLLLCFDVEDESQKQTRLLRFEKWEK